MKEIFALYLPQFHETKENNEWWVKGYTEWNAVKDAKSLFRGHVQPRVPLDERYYDLSDESGETWRWQAETAVKYGLSGFCIYHYWFKDCKKMLEKPMEILYLHPEINIQYFVCWANEPWKKTWYGNEGQILLEQEYGSQTEWIEHYNYLRRFFLDKRYKKINNCPVIAIYKTAGIDVLKEMKELWSQLAKKDGFEGIYLLGAKTAFEQETRRNLVDGEYIFEPQYTMHYQYGVVELAKKIAYRYSHRFINGLTHKGTLENMEDMRDLYKKMKLPEKSVACDLFYGICPSWDSTPRKQYKGTVFRNSSPALFKRKIVEMLNDNKAGNIIMINAWNEWSEGAYLEPDTYNQYRYLEVIKEAVEGK